MYRYRLPDIGCSLMCMFIHHERVRAKLQNKIKQTEDYKTTKKRSDKIKDSLKA